MATARDVARSHHRERSRLARSTAAAAMALWREVSDDDIARSWAALVARLLVLVTGAQRAAAQRADDYVSRVLDAQDLDPAPAGEVRPEALSGVASDGRPLASLLYTPAITALRAIRSGRPVSEALRSGRAAVGTIVRTQVEDAGRVADGVAVAVRPSVGYTRYVNPPACSRCIILAGRFYRYNTGFLRHPLCDCIHVPTRNERYAESEGLISDPRSYFDSLSREEQDRIFTRAGAQAIRDGADISQVVNARRGAAGLSRAGARLTLEEQRIIRGGRDRGRLTRTSVYGRDVFVTDEGTTRRGLAGSRLGALNPDAIRVPGERYRRARTPRLMPESIYELARDRDEAIRLLRRFGYIR